jgi:hypothetical protein
MVSVAEPHHLESEGLLPEIGGIPKGDGQIDLLGGQVLLPWHDTVEGCSVLVEPGSANPHGIEGLGVHDVEVTTPIHQHLGEPRVANDGINNKRVLA